MREVINQPFAVTETKGAYDVFVNVNGGGYAGQSGAIRHGIARALLEVDPDFRLALKRAGLLTRDARMVERKNQVLKKLVKLHNSQNVNILFISIFQDTFQLFGKCLFIIRTHLRTHVNHTYSILLKCFKNRFINYVRCVHVYFCSRNIRVR